MCLDATASNKLASPNQLRPVHASASQKGYNYRRTGLTTQFTPTRSSLVDFFQNAVWEHLTDCGMDTIAYLPDPEDSLMMTNVVKSHSRYTVQTANKALGASQLLLYDLLSFVTSEYSLCFLVRNRCSRGFGVRGVHCQERMPKNQSCTILATKKLNFEHSDESAQITLFMHT